MEIKETRQEPEKANLLKRIERGAQPDRKLVFDSTTGELKAGNPEQESTARNIVVDQIYRDGFFGMIPTRFQHDSYRIFGCLPGLPVLGF